MITARKDVRERVYLRDNGTCGICGDPVDFKGMHLDHVVPLSVGGPDTEENVQVAHAACNFRKNGEHDGLYPNQRQAKLRESASGELVRVLLRVPDDLWEEIRRWAEEDDRSLNQQVVHLLRRAVAEWRS